MRLRLFIILLFFPLSYTLAIQFRHLDMKDGLSQLSVLSIYQDKLGRMWFGTEEGINLYDGNGVKAYKSYENKTGKIRVNVSYIVGDEEGNVYFTADNSLMKYDIVTQKFTCLIEENIHGLYCVGNRLYFGKNDALYSTDVKHFKPVLICQFGRNQYVKSVRIDHRGRFWIGTMRGLYIIEKGKKAHVQIGDGEINDIFEDSQRNMWVSTRSNGFFLFHYNNGRIEHFEAHPKPTWQSFYNYANKEMTVSHHIASNMVRGINEDDSGNIWLGTFLGLNEYNPKTGIFKVYAHTNNPYSISHSSVFPVFKDKLGALWVGTYYGGVNYFNPNHDLFTFYSADINRKDCLSYPFVGHMTEDKRGTLWICTEGGGLNRMNRTTGELTHYMMSGAGNSIAHNNLKNIVYDAQRDKLYIGTHTGGMSFFDIQTGKFDNIWVQRPAYSALCGDQIFDMKLWGNYVVFTTQNGIWKINVNTADVSSLFPSKKEYGYRYFHIDSKGFIWIATKNGLYRILLTDERKQRFFKCGEKGLGRSVLTDVGEDTRHRIFIATRGSGLYWYDERLDRFENLNTKNSNLISNFCYEIVNYRNELIINSDRGVCLFDPYKQTFRNIELSPDFPLTGIHIGCGIYVCRNGDIFVGGTNGLVSFRADKIHHRQENERLFVSRIFVNNNEVFPEDESGILKKAPYYTDKIALDYNQNDLTLYFSNNNYTSMYHRPTYEYKLEGYDEKWISTNDRRINYTNISPGNYTLVIREQKSSFKKQPGEIRIDITVHAPWYKTPLAYLLYLVALFTLLYYIYRFKRSQLILKTSLEMGEREKKNIEELNKAKLRFFTSISHEFRTPLTLLMAKLDSITGDITPGTTLHKKLKGLKSNANQLLGLINELLDFRKMEQGHIKLKVTENDMVAFARDIYRNFTELADSKAIRYTFTTSQPVISCWFDAKQMEKVIYNLLSNAFKYIRSENGSIELQVLSEDKTVVIKVLDNGMGISAGELDKVFERFYQSDISAQTSSPSSGTGIGLALVKEIVHLHHGSVRVESSQGYGSVFIVSLQKGNSQFTTEEKVKTVEHTPHIVKSETIQPHDSIDLPEPESTENSQYTILLVEDNEELLVTLKELFAKTCNVMLATNGREALEQIRLHKPDLILSDIMMPVMNGMELCKTVKEDITISHIPIILLTAMGSTEHTIKGLKYGADDYIAKPFDPQLLVVRCNNLVRSRALLRNTFMKDTHSESELLGTTPLDQKFLRDCNSYIDSRLNDTDFSVDDMAQALMMGRSTFFNKFKDLTGMTPNEYVLAHKIKLSAVWLKEKRDLQIADIAYRLGFSSPRYFSHCFKNRYGVTPKEFRASS